jgi:hypothetical protein
MLTRTKPMQQNAYEEEVLEVNNNDNDEGTDSQETADVSEEQEVEQDRTEDESVSVSRTEYDKLRREAAAAKRLREKGRESGKESSGKEASPQYDQELIERTYLASMGGINDPDIQDEALKMARKLNMTVTELVKDEFVKDRLAFLQKQKVARRAVDKGNTGSTTQQKGVDYWVKKYKQDGSMPTDPKVLSQMLDRLAE